MQAYSIRDLCGNPTLEQFEIIDDMRDDARTPFLSSGALPDELAAEMADAFGWDRTPTEDELEAEYAAQRCDEEELIARYPGLRDAAPETLIGIIGDPNVGLMGDGEEVVAVAAILLARQLDNAAARRTA